MRGAHIARRRGFERFLAILSAFAIFTSLMVMYAPAALAHHPLITAGQVCADGAVRISYESVSWKTDGTSGSGHNDIRIEVLVNNSGNWAEVGNGAYNAGNSYRFSGSFDPAPYVGDSIQVRARANGPWTNGQGGNETRTTSAFVVDLVCTDGVTVAANPQVCAVDQQGVAQGAISFDIAPATGATVQVFANSNLTGPVGGALGDDVVLSLSPGTYYWQATAANGFAVNGSATGQFTISPCTASTLVVAGVCAVNANGAPLGSVQVTIDPNSGATLVISGPGGPYNFSGSGGSAELAPGSYSWQATPGPGFTLGGQSSGAFDIDPCEASVSVDSDVCELVGSPVGAVEVGIDPDSSAIVTVYSDAALTNPVATFTGVGGTASLAPGTYYWAAAAGGGFSLTGDTSGSFTIEPCNSSVTVVSGACVINTNGAPVGSVEVVIDPDSGATVVLSGPGGPYDFTGSGGSEELVPGDYTWVASPGNGFALTGDAAGGFTIDPCPSTAVVASGNCVINSNGAPAGQVNVTIDPASGATVVISGPGGSYDFSGSGGSQELAPGDYTWQATATSGFELTGDVSGEFNIEPCDVSVVVADGECELVGGAMGSVTVFIDAASGATVTVYDAGMNVAASFVGTGGTSALAPGTYTWEATPGDGFDFPDGQQTSGEFTVDPCEGTVIVSHSNCVEGAATAFGSVTVIVDPDGAATVTIFNSNSQEVAVLSGGTHSLTAGIYTWLAEAESGLTVAGETSGSFTVVACPDEVLDEGIENDDPVDEVRDLEVLPFTGIDTRTLFAASVVLLGTGWILIKSARRREES